MRTPGGSPSCRPAPGPASPPPPRRADPSRRPRLEAAAAAASFLLRLCLWSLPSLEPPRSPRGGLRPSALPLGFGKAPLNGKHPERGAAQGWKPRVPEPALPAEDSAEGDGRPPRPPGVRGPAPLRGRGEQTAGTACLLAAVKKKKKGGCLEPGSPTWAPRRA